MEGASYGLGASVGVAFWRANTYDHALNAYVVGSPISALVDFDWSRGALYVHVSGDLAPFMFISFDPWYPYCCGTALGVGRVGPDGRAGVYVTATDWNIPGFGVRGTLTPWPHRGTGRWGIQVTSERFPFHWGGFSHTMVTAYFRPPRRKEP